MENNNTILSDLKKGMFLTRTIPEPIMRSLTYLPFAIFEGAKKVELDYDLNFDDYTASYFNVKLSGVNQNDSDFDKKRDLLIKSVRELLWNDLSVSVVLKE